VKNLKPNPVADGFNVFNLTTNSRLRGKRDKSGVLLIGGKVIAYYDIDKK
jgi:hypothetical protein